ncbi:WD40/YVTN/BNR-like repeat-containing protein [Marinobacterium arenosum]|uniref:WD40/YVTN/BNR-like repeat-containing protein n=1 Tax=Marinobacterium arenosum TaxID=2862496 RepID=UPI002107DA77|nr:YCF48-related protein [Marinobacterium arenosum]
MLSGCEAPLNLEGVEQEQAKSIRRTDQFQALAANDSTLVAVGGDGLVLTKDRNAADWQRMVLPGQPALIDLVVCPDQSFAALSMERQVWTSDAKGLHWQAVELPTEEDVLALTCAPDNGLWVVGSFSTILGSADKGVSWNQNSLNEDAMLTAIQFLDGDQVVVSGEFGLVAKSRDGGRNWQPSEYMPDDFYPQGVHFTNAAQGWAAGLSGTILHTEDGGLSWQAQVTPTESPLYGFHKSGDRLFALGDHGTVLELNGDSWRRIATPNIPVYLRDGEALNDNQLLVAGGWGALFTVVIK